MSQYYEERINRFRVYKKPTQQFHSDGSEYPWRLEWSFSNREDAESRLEKPSYEREGLYMRKLVDNGEPEIIRREVW